MELKTLLREDIEREHEFMHTHEVGSEEYNNSFKRLCELENKLFDLEKFESETASKNEQLKDEKKDRTIKYVFEGVKIASGIVVPMIGLVCITAFEKNDTFTSALKGYVNCFIPKKTI